MLYVTGEHALNLPCSLDTCGDWHTSAMNWDRIQVAESEGSVFGDWGIEALRPTSIRQLAGYHYVANTLRALLDLIVEGRLCYLNGAKNDFISNDKYHLEFFEHVIQCKGLLLWDKLDDCMCKEFGKEWWEWKDGK